MGYIKDKSIEDVIYVNKNNLISAKNNEVIVLRDNEHSDAVKQYIKVISSSYNINKVDEQVLEYIIKNYNVYATDSYYRTISKYIDKSVSTIIRSIAKLRDSHLIYIDKDNIINLTNNINSKGEIINARVIVIEINTII